LYTDIRDEEKGALEWAMWVKNVSFAITQLIAMSSAFFTFFAMTSTGYDITISQVCITTLFPTTA